MTSKKEMNKKYNAIRKGIKIKYNAATRSEAIKYLRSAGIKINKNISKDDLATMIRKATGWQMRHRGTKTVIIYFVKCLYVEDVTKVIINTDIHLALTSPKKKPTKNFVQGKDFLSSFQWRQVRYKALKLNDGRCELCGASKHDGITLNVDHIKPRKTHPHLALDIKNLQVLCNVCNHGKGNWDDTDWRKDAR